MPEQPIPKGSHRLFLPELYFNIFLTNTKPKAPSAEQQDQMCTHGDKRVCAVHTGLCSPCQGHGTGPAPATPLNMSQAHRSPS